jgi:hypothetical protein
MVAFTITCLWLGWHMHQARQQEAAVRELLKVPGRADRTPLPPRMEYSYQFTRRGAVIPNAEPIWPKWLLRSIGEDFFLRVVGVSMDGRGATNADLFPLAELPYLHQLDLEYTAVTDDGLAFVAEHCPKLTRLDLQESQITPAGLENVSKLVHLRDLLIGKCDVTDEHLEYFATLDDLDHLALRRTKIRGEGLKHLIGLTKLRSLDLDRTKLTEAAVEPLSQMTQLKELVLTGTDLSRGGIERLKSALPTCRITTAEEE